VAVRTNDIALRHFSEDSLGPGASDHLTDKVRFRRGIAVIELHHVRWESLNAIQTGHIAQRVQHFGLCAGTPTLIFNPGRLAAAGPAPVMVCPLSPRPHRMAVGAHNIAFRDLG
jgi:hypothetical protein